MSDTNHISDARCVQMEDLEETATWCGGDIGIVYEGEGEGQHYIQVGNDRAVVGDWITTDGLVFKKLTAAEYAGTFYAAAQHRDKFKKTLAIITAAIHDGSVHVIHGVGVNHNLVAEQAALLIMELFEK